MVQKTRTITEREFNESITYINKHYKKYIPALKEMFFDGADIPAICKKYNFPRRSLQWAITRMGLQDWRSLRYGHIGLSLSKGETMKSIRERLGYSLRNDLNNLMAHKVRGIITKKKRWRVFRRDNFKCVLCGVTGAERILHCDHIIPVSKCGTSKMKNLRTICEPCNLGKGDELENDEKLIDGAMRISS